MARKTRRFFSSSSSSSLRCIMDAGGALWPIESRGARVAVRWVIVYVKPKNITGAK